MSWRQDAPTFAAISSGVRIGRRGAAVSVAILVALAAAAAAAAAAAERSAQTSLRGRSPFWRISIMAPRFGRLYPGGPPVLITFTVTGSRRDAILHHVAAAVALDSRTGDIETGAGTPVPGCLGRWFSLTTTPDGPPLPVPPRDAGQPFRGQIRLAMMNAPVDQDACQRGAPAVTVVAS